MFPVSDIWEDAKDIFGHASEPKLLRWITDAVQLLANKGEIDPLIGNLDICVDGKCVTPPREVETILAINIGGHPSIGRSELFRFHLNGPGDFHTSCTYEWDNVGAFCTYQDIDCPSKVVAFLDRPEDDGKLIKIWGFDEQNRPLRTKVGNTWVDGYIVPTIYGYAVPDVNAPMISRITDIQKAVTVGGIRLSTIDNSGQTGKLLGVYEPDETLPRYRRIRLSHAATHCRIIFRKASLSLRSQSDRIYLHSRLALLLACRAVKKYHEEDIPEALAFEAHATRILTEREDSLTSPAEANPIQVNFHGGMKLTGRDDVD